MVGYNVVSSGQLVTSRLTVNHICTEPTDDVCAPRILLLGGSNFDLRLRPGLLNTILPKRARFASYEPRGIGAAELPSGQWTMHDYAQDALCVLDALGWDDAIIIGESFGAMTSLHLAHLAPNRIRAMVLASGASGGAGGSSYDISEFLPLPRSEVARRSLYLQDSRNIELEKKDHPAFVAKLTTATDFEETFFHPSISSGGYERLLTARSAHDAWEKLPEIDVETLVVAGEFDQQARLEVQVAMAEKLGNARLKAFASGHGLLFADTDVLDYIFNGFLDKIAH